MVVVRHALKNAAIPIVTIVGLDIGTLLGGAVITETVFAWPGIGRLAIEAIAARDFPVVQADVFFIALAFVVINLVRRRAVHLARPSGPARGDRPTSPRHCRSGRRVAPPAPSRPPSGRRSSSWWASPPWARPGSPPTIPGEQVLERRLRPPAWSERGEWAYPLGTDHLGRDILSRLIYGSRISLLVGITSVVISGLPGRQLGVLAGYYGGRLDALIMRLVDIQLAFPFILLAISVIAVLGAGLRNVIIVLGRRPLDGLRAGGPGRRPDRPGA